MKLTLSAGGGFTGLSKQHSIAVDSLDEQTLQSLKDYFSSAAVHKSPANYHETWSLDSGQEVPVNPATMSSELRQLYMQMKSNLTYGKEG